MPEPQTLDAGDRATTRLVIHADDVGMNHGANRAFVELSRFGTVTACSVMAPCPWFSEIAETAAADDRLDCGVHLTLNSEMAHYRWGPVTRAGAASGLLDGDDHARSARRPARSGPLAVDLAVDDDSEALPAGMRRVFADSI